MLARGPRRRRVQRRRRRGDPARRPPPSGGGRPSTEPRTHRAAARDHRDAGQGHRRAAAGQAQQGPQAGRAGRRRLVRRGVRRRRLPAQRLLRLVARASPPGAKADAQADKALMSNQDIGAEIDARRGHHPQGRRRRARRQGPRRRARPRGSCSGSGPRARSRAQGRGAGTAVPDPDRRGLADLRVRRDEGRGDDADERVSARCRARCVTLAVVLGDRGASSYPTPRSSRPRWSWSRSTAAAGVDYSEATRTWCGSSPSAPTPGPART